MGIATTTAGAIRDALIPLIEALTPTKAEHREQKWVHTGEDDPSGPQLRRFTIINGPSVETFGGIHGGAGIEYEFEMTIRVAYGGLPRDLASDLIDEDARDLWLLIHPLPDAGGIDGLLPFVSPLETDFFDDEPGSLVVDFILEPHYKGRD